MTEEWERLAGKLADTGFTDDEARDWVREVVSDAWVRGYDDGLIDGGAGDSTARNPYRTDGPVEGA